MAEPPARRMGYRKEDKDSKTAKVTVIVQHLMKKRDKVDVQIPQNSSEPLIVKLNDSVICEKILPADIIQKDSSWKVKHGKKGAVEIKLRKVTAGNWMGKWVDSQSSSGGSDSD